MHGFRRVAGLLAGCLALALAWAIGWRLLLLGIVLLLLAFHLSLWHAAVILIATAMFAVSVARRFSGLGERMLNRLRARGPSSSPRFTLQVVGVGLIFAAGLAGLFGALLPEPPVPRGIPIRFSNFPGMDRILLGLSFAGAPLIEEAIFRGWLQTGLAELMRPIYAICAAALLFGLVHMQYWGAPGLLGLTVLAGVVYGLAFWLTGTLWSAVALHAATNLLGAVAMLSAGAAEGSALVAAVSVALLVASSAWFVVIAWRAGVARRAAGGGLAGGTVKQEQA